MQVVAITRNLMDAELIRANVAGATVVRAIDHPSVGSADMLVLDLGSGIAPADVVALGIPVIAYGPHVDTEALQAAVVAGCQEALPRSQVFRRLATLVGC